MVREIDNLRQLSQEQATVSSTAAKREKQHERIGRRLATGNVSSIERAVRFGELRQKVFDAWHVSSERAETLGQRLAEETERVGVQLTRLRELGTQDPTVHSIYTVYQTEFEIFTSGRAPLQPEVEQPAQLTLEEPQPTAAEAEPAAAQQPEEAEEMIIALGRRGYKKESVIPDFYEKKPRVLTLPNGESFEVDSAWPYYLAQYIAEHTNSVRDIAIKVFGEDNKKNRGRVSAAIPAANQSIIESGFLFKNVTPASERGKGVLARYEFQPQEGEIKPRPTPKSIADATPLAPRSTPRLAAVVDVPYEPTPDEIRRPEETRIVAAITEALTKSQRLYFDQLQRALRTEAEERFRITRAGQRQYKPYQMEELRRLFESGLRKLREESAGTSLREKWTEEELRIWETTQGLVHRTTENNNFDEYLRRVKRLIEEAEKGFYEPHGGKPVLWINLPLENGDQYESR